MEEEGNALKWVALQKTLLIPAGTKWVLAGTKCMYLDLEKKET